MDFESHGREEIFDGVDLSRTVGWFTTLYPVALELPDSEDTRAAIASIRAQLSSVPNRGLGYGVLQYLDERSAPCHRLAEARSSDVLFHYLGRWDEAVSGSQGLRLAEPIRVYRAPKQARDHALEIVAVVFDRQLHIEWTYSPTLHVKATIEQLADKFLTHLRRLLQDCRKQEGQYRSAADFPLADLSQEGLEDLLADLGEPG